jgi:excisionase family DNA binding protein
MSTEKFITPSEVLARLEISYPTFIRMIKSRSIPSVKIGKQIRVPLSYFEKLEQEANGSIEEVQK